MTSQARQPAPASRTHAENRAYRLNLVVTDEMFRQNKIAALSASLNACNETGEAVSESSAEAKSLRRAGEGFRWDGVEHRPYKDADSAPFKAISRQTLFSDPRLLGELRYFEIGPGGFSTLERHEHMHAVMVLRGRGQCLVDGAVHALEPYDLITIRPWSWHQFRTSGGAPLGFLCLVNSARDRPQLPSAQDLAALRANPVVARFLDGDVDTSDTRALPRDAATSSG